VHDPLDDLLAYLGESPTPYHAVEAAARRLGKAGFVRLSEAAAWKPLSPGRYYITPGGSSLLAFVVPDAAPTGFRIVGAHTDSPNLRLKPKAEYAKEGYDQLGVEVYGGALLNSWFDLDLGLAGRLLVRGADGKTSPRLVEIRRPLLRIPRVAIHLDREVNEKGFIVNRQDHLAPILGMASDGALGVRALVAEVADVDPADVVGQDLMLFDVNPPTLGGRDRELIFSARLDNLAMCHASIAALVECAGDAAARDVIPVAALFDHEEVGSESAYGAASGFLPRALERIATSRGGSRDDYLRALAGSMCVSADMAHAIHPNYDGKHEPRHKPELNGGPVIKVNAQQRYATSGATAAMFSELCREVVIPVQHYAHRTDLPCGSTIGPITSTQLGIRTVDVGNPMLSMHSAREMSGAKDPAMMTRVMQAFYGARDPEAT
jgi:aspartyl aminopeptidase